MNRPAATGFLLCVMLCALLAACPAWGGAKGGAKGAPKAQAAPDDSEIVARVGQETITEDELLAAMGRVYTPNPSQDMRRILQGMVETRALAQEARKSGLERDPEVKRRLAEAADGVLARAWQERQAAKLTITDEAARREYDAHPDKYAQPPKLRLAHIMVKDQAQAAALSARLKRGESFEDLARKESTDTSSAAHGGDLGWREAGSITPEVEQAARQLKPGEVAPEPVKSPFGYHLVKLLGRQEAQPRSFEAVKAAIKDALKRQELARLRQEAVKRAKVQILLPVADTSPGSAPAH